MRSNLQERRMSAHLAGVIDDALCLAEECGWRYAIMYLVSEDVPSPIIQRLLSGGGRVYRPSSLRHQSWPDWKGGDAEVMNRLFEWLRQRRSHQAGERDAALLAARTSPSIAETD